MNRFCIEKSTNRLIEFQQGKAPLGTLSLNAVNAGYHADEIKEDYTEDDYKTCSLKHETVDQKSEREEKEIKISVLNDLKKNIKNKHKGKKISDLSKDDIDEWLSIQIAGDLGLEIL